MYVMHICIHRHVMICTHTQTYIYIHIILSCTDRHELDAGADLHASLKLNVSACLFRTSPPWGTTLLTALEREREGD